MKRTKRSLAFLLAMLIMAGYFVTVPSMVLAQEPEELQEEPIATPTPGLPAESTGEDEEINQETTLTEEADISNEPAVETKSATNDIDPSLVQIQPLAVYTHQNINSSTKLTEALTAVNKNLFGDEHIFEITETFMYNTPIKISGDKKITINLNNYAIVINVNGPCIELSGKAQLTAMSGTIYLSSGTGYPSVANDGSRFQGNIVQKTNGWEKINNDWYYFSKGIIQTDWLKEGNAWYYLMPSGKMVTGWLTINNARYFFHTGGGGIPTGKMATGWTRIPDRTGPWYYFSSDGRCLTGWQRIGSAWYYLDPKSNPAGQMQTGWQTLNKVTYYFKSSGAMATGWERIPEKTGSWYYFSSTGARVTGWQRVGSTWYYMDPASNPVGQMVTGPRTIKNVEYLFRSNGSMATGWEKVGRFWYYYSSSGAKVTGWIRVNNVWYYLDPNSTPNKGVMVTGQRTINGVDYLFRSSGAMATGWEKVGNSWYYYKSSGAMAKSEWLLWNNTWYYLKSDGTMATSADGLLTIRGKNYRFTAGGAWIPS